MKPLARPLRVVVLYSAGHLGSALTMNRLADMSEIEIVGVLRAQPLSLSRVGKQRIGDYLRKLGWQFAWLLVYQRIVQGVGYALSLLLPASNRRLLPAWKIARKFDIPVFETRDINAVESLAFMQACQPDILVSAYFSQILQAEVLQVAQHGVLNIHPGWLPSYRGAMAYFWVLHNGSDRGGVSVHWIDEGIDSGEILERRAFSLPPGATQETVLRLTAVIGTRLLRRVIRRLQSGEKASVIETGVESGQDDYYPLPGGREFAHYFEQRRFFRIRDILGLIAFRGLRR